MVAMVIETFIGVPANIWSNSAWIDSFILHQTARCWEVHSYKTVCSVEDQNLHTDGIATGSQTSVSFHDTFEH